MDKNNLFENLKPEKPSIKWEDSFLERLEKQKRVSKNKITIKSAIYFSFIFLNLFAIFYSLKITKENKIEDKYQVLSESLFSSNNF